MSRAGPTLVLVLWGVVGGRALDVRVNGDVLFAMQLSEAAQRRLERAAPPARARAAPRSAPDPTLAPALSCRFHFPEQEQVDAILSNMMNDLTKVFVRADHFLKSEDNTRNSGVWRAEDRSPPATPPSSAGPAAAVSSPAPAPSPPPSPSSSPSAQTTTSMTLSNRFKVVNSKKTQFFEYIFHNMTEEFRSLSNASEPVARARGDPCAQQHVVRRAWRDLLHRSLAAFRRAALNCVQEYLKIQDCDERTKARLVRYLVRELGKIRERHLQMLCDRFKLCLDEGLLA